MRKVQKIVIGERKEGKKNEEGKVKLYAEVEFSAQG